MSFSYVQIKRQFERRKTNGEIYQPIPIIFSDHLSDHRICIFNERSRLFCRRKFKCRQTFKSSFYYHWIDDRSHGNITSRNCSQCNSVYCQYNALAISNVVGSNIFNMMFVIGVCSILATIGVKRETIIRDIPLSLVCATLLLIFGYLAFGDRSHMILGRFDGIIFLIIFAVYVLMMVFQAMRARIIRKSYNLKQWKMKN